ncbi:hypothetical protein NECAME_09843 [Necator americanus]|uniref:Uncharacterized protein n=1 Tax=Necator americanus TaxID=51031 RepID=W2TBJ4_NECAM|nr:hypothetical protein NECAME_09843 [Necator americanus]ETN79405.1 hypothetical protein NECAME_09843 [Necator americanus]
MTVRRPGQFETEKVDHLDCIAFVLLGPETTLSLLLNLEVYEIIPGTVSDSGVILSIHDPGDISSQHHTDGIHLEAGKVVTIPINEVRKRTVSVDQVTPVAQERVHPCTIRQEFDCVAKFTSQQLDAANDLKCPENCEDVTFSSVVFGGRLVGFKDIKVS